MTAGPALEMWSQQTAKQSTDGIKYIEEYQRAFTVTLAAGDPTDEARNAQGLPPIGAAFSGAKLTVFCLDQDIQRVSPIMAIATCRYRGEVGPPTGGSSGGGDPWDLQTRVEWTTTVEDVEISRDWNGDLLQNPNGEPIRGITEKFYDDVLTVEKPYLTVNPYALRLYRMATNSDTFAGWPPGTARIVQDNRKAVFIGGTIAYWNVTVSIQFRWPIVASVPPAEAWYKRVLIEGLKERDTPSAEPRPAWDPVTKTLEQSPVKLKADGTRAADNEEFYETKQTLGSLPFSALGLGV